MRLIDADALKGKKIYSEACMELGRSAYGFEISRAFYKRAKEEMLTIHDPQLRFAL